MHTLVVVPTYNEAANVGTVIDQVDDLGFDLLVVDDGSADGTAELVELAASELPGVHLLRRSSKDGLGSAYRAGFTWALEQGCYDVVCQMDADLSHDPLDLQPLVAAVDNGADVAIGSRYVPGGSTPGWSWSRRWLSRAGNTYMRLVTGVRVKDMTAGFRAWRAGALEQLSLCQTESEGYSFQLETTALAWAHDQHITEVPIAFSDRTEGESKMSAGIILEALWRVVIIGWNIRRPSSTAPAMGSQHLPVQAQPAGDPGPVSVRASDGPDLIMDGPDLIIDLRDDATAHQSQADEKVRDAVDTPANDRT